MRCQKPSEDKDCELRFKIVALDDAIEFDKQKRLNKTLGIHHFEDVGTTNFSLPRKIQSLAKLTCVASCDPSYESYRDLLCSF